MLMNNNGWNNESKGTFGLLSVNRFFFWRKRMNKEGLLMKYVFFYMHVLFVVFIF